MAVLSSGLLKVDNRLMIRWQRAGNPSWIDAEVVLDRSLVTSTGLDVLQEILIAAAPRWASKLRIWRSQGDERWVDAREPGALKSAVLAAAGERGPTYRMLVECYGRPPSERLTGSAELRGSHSEFVVVITVDEWIACPLGKKIDLGNTVALQVRHPTVERRERAIWTREIFEILCARMAPVWGAACHPDEYWTKVMSESPSIEAVGRDFGRFLPGLFWLNFFGMRYRDLIGDERLQATPAECATVGDGTLLWLASDPRNWSLPKYADVENRVLQKIGPQFFYSKLSSSERTLAPRWNIGP